MNTHIPDRVHVEAGFFPPVRPKPEPEAPRPFRDLVLAAMAETGSLADPKDAAQAERLFKECPTLGPSNARAWERLRRAKTFYLRVGDTTYFVDRGGWARAVGYKAASVRASRLLDQAKKPEPGRRRNRLGAIGS